MRIERIVSAGQASPPGFWYDQPDDEFVVLLTGAARLRFEEGDSLFIPGYLRHNEIRTADSLEILEVSTPGVMGTKPCEAPAGFKG